MTDDESGRYHTLNDDTADTDTSNEADTLPAVTTIRVEPAFTPVTVPIGAHRRHRRVQGPPATALFVAFAGDTVAENLTEEPTDTVREPDTDTIDTGTGPAAFTTTLTDALLPPADTVIVAVPAFTTDT